MHHDPGDLGSLMLIWIIPKESTQSDLELLSKGITWHQHCSGSEETMLLA